MEETLAWKHVDQIVRQHQQKKRAYSTELSSPTKTFEPSSDECGAMIMCRKYNPKNMGYSGCGAMGHIFRFCPQNQCRMCNRYGHLHIDCPYAPIPQVNLWEEPDVSFLNQDMS